MISCQDGKLQDLSHCLLTDPRIYGRMTKSGVSSIRGFCHSPIDIRASARAGVREHERERAGVSGTQRG